MILCGKGHEIQSRYLQGEWPKVSAAPEPTVINWHNLRYASTNRCLRTSTSLLVSLILMAASFTIIIIGKQYEQDYKEKYTTVECGQRVPSQTEAWVDYQKP
jgi:hypothetical protein